MINFEERQRYGVYFVIERTDSPDYIFKEARPGSNVPTSFLFQCVDSQLAKEVEKWCNDNCVAKWTRNASGGETMPMFGRWTFWNAKDAMTFKMIWGNYKREWEDPFAIKRK